jgi:hypothetical protein
MSNESLRVDADGTVVHTPVMSDRERASKFSEIIAMIDDPDAPLAPIKRRIALEIATVNQQMMLCTEDTMDVIKVKSLESQVKALRELGKELTESDVLSKKDFLNWNGPKLAFVLSEYMQGAVDTLKKIGIDDGTTQQFLRQWRDWAIEAEPRIRKSADKLNFDSVAGQGE